MKNISLFILFILGTSSLAWTHEKKSTQKYPIHFALLNESISFPNFDFLKYSYNPGVLIGTEYSLIEKEKHDWHLTGNIGYYYHKDWKSAVFINSEIGYRYHLNKWAFSLRAGIGYAHAFNTKPVYQFKEGRYQKVTDYGSPLFTSSLGLNISYKLKSTPYSPEIFTTYTSSVDLPFSIFNGLHHFVGIGYKFYPFKRK